MPPTTGATTLADTNPSAHRLVAWPWRERGKAATAMDWPMGIIGAATTPWAKRQKTSSHRLVAMPQPARVTTKPRIESRNNRLRPSLVDSQPTQPVTTEEPMT